MKRIYAIANAIVSPLGFTSEENFQRVLNDESGLHLQNFDFSDTPFCVATIAEERLNAAFAAIGDPAQFTKLEKMSILSVSEVQKQVPFSFQDTDTLFIYCTTKGNTELLDTTPDAAPESVRLSRLARTIATFFGFAHEPVVVSNACISSLQGIIIARRLLAAGLYKHIVVAGGDVVSKFTLSGFRAFNALSNQPCLPFDAQREGINLGEAAVSMVLSTESTTHAIEVVAGYSTNDANHISAPSRTGEGLYKALTQVLTQADVAEIDFISAHGTATRYNDEMESQALSRAGLNTLPMHSLKAYFGHTLGAAGMLESIMGIYSVQHGTTIPSRGYHTVGTSIELQPIRTQESRPMKGFLKTSSGFGGCNAAVMFRKNG